MRRLAILLAMGALAAAAPTALAQGPSAPAKPAAAAPPAGGGGDAKDGTPPPPPPPLSVDLQKLRADYDRLRDELYRARARAQAVQEGLYTSKLGATLRWEGAPDYQVRRAEIRLDGASIWDSGDKPVNDALIKVAERAVKPGTHALTVRLEVRPAAAAKKAGGDADQLGYTSEHTFVVVVAEGRRITAEITGDEDGDPPEYEPEIEVEIKSEK